ncbi:MAG TPA: hypothetical protein VEK79_23735 [Thermoanaerobaculia bacterium]|nr:hypothetical protein [Thermoanaerobaculia bacterium]
MALIENGSFDAVVSDIAMPVEDGLTLVRHIREQSKDRGSRSRPSAPARTTIAA